jgi:hypothetical protein
MNRTLGAARIRPEVVSAALLVILSAAAGSQSTAPGRSPRGIISGEVVEAAMLRPLSGATVVLVPSGAAALPPIVETGSSFFSLGRSVVTGELGAYRFTDLPFGDYQLRVQRVGYRPVTIDVQLRASDDARVSVGLTVAPIRLHALTVRADPKPPYGRMEAATEEETASRVGAARLRQRLFLGTDVREVTHPDVVEAVTLGTTDLFRALHRLPGVTTRDEDAAELWTRGSRPDQTRVYFDGLPLFGPLHALGAFTGISTHAVGAAFLHPGVRSASMAEGGAAVLDVRSRPGGGVGDLRGVAELGTAAGLAATGARIALDRQARDGRSAWMIAGARSLFDLGVRPGFANTYGYAAPAYFADVAGRFDYKIGPGRHLELSGLWMRDVRLDARTEFSSTPRAFDWGNDIGRATLSWSLGGLRSRHTIGASRFSARVDTLTHPPFDPNMGSAPIRQRELPMRSSVVQASLSGEFESEVRPGELTAWTFGYDLTARQVDFDGDTRHALLRIESSRSARAWETPTASVWGTRRWGIGDRLVVEPGLRIDAGPAPANAGPLRAMPRLQARFALDSQTMLSAGVGRSYQYTQAIGRLETGIEALVYPTPLWVASDRSTPALRTDVATLGLERWLAGTWLVAANAYSRRSAGYLLPDPTPGLLGDRATFVEGKERATGVELSARKLAGPLTGSASYSYGIARTAARGFTYPSSQDRRHSVDVAVLARLRPSLQFSTAFTYATGAPFTRMRSIQRTPQDFYYVDLVLADSLLAGPPNAARKPSFASLDVALDWSFSVYGVRAATFIQFRNALMHDNPGIYYGSSRCSECKDVFLSNRSSNFLLPAIGLRARF